MNGMDPEEMIGKIIECSFDGPSETWVYMRERRDKITPNAWHVFLKVLQSIQDNITDASLLESIDEALQEKVYEKDVSRSAPGLKSGQ